MSPNHPFAWRDPRAIHQSVNATKGRLAEIDRSLHTGFVGHVSTNKRRACANLGGEGSNRLRVYISQYHVGTLFGEQLSRCPAESGAAARNEECVLWELHRTRRMR